MLLDQQVASDAIPGTKLWDYLVELEGRRVVAIEVHPARSNQNHRDVLEKAQWLRQAILPPFQQEGWTFCLHWLATGSVHKLPQRSPQRMQLAAAGVKGPSSQLDLGQCAAGHPR